MRSKVTTSVSAQRSSPGTELFLRMWAAWAAAIPRSLKREDPGLLIRLLQQCDSEEGISQAELRKILNLDQPSMSRLSKRLRGLGWLEDSIPRGDGRLRLTKLTPKGKGVLNSLSAVLNNARTSFRSGDEGTRERDFTDELDAILDRI